MKTITIAPLATPRSISLAVWDAVTHAPRLFLQTSEHPSARRICEAGIPFESMDDLYCAAEDFDALNAAIAARLFSAPEEDVVYAVPGRGVGQAQDQQQGQQPGQGKGQAAQKGEDRKSVV